MLVKVVVQIVGGLFEVEILDLRSGVSTNLCRDVLEKQFSEDIVEAAFADSFLDVGVEC